MTRTALALASLTVTLALIGCGSGSNSPDPPPPPPPPPPTPPTTVDFTAYLKGIMLRQANAEPADIDGLNFTFTDNNNPAAYDDIVGAP